MEAIAEDIYNMDSIFDEEEKATHMNSVSIGAVDAPDLFMSSGVISLDLILGGGIRANRWYEICGEESSGKSTILYSCFGQALKAIPNKVKGIFLDIEGTVDYEWFSNISGVKDLTDVFGVRDKDTGDWIKKPVIRYFKPPYGEAGLQFIKRILKRMPDKVLVDDTWYYLFVPKQSKKAKEEDPEGGYKKLQSKLKDRYSKKLLTKTGNFYVPVPNNYAGPELMIGIDCLAAMTPEAVAEDDSNAMSVNARMFSKHVNDIKTLVTKKAISVVALNQIREKPMCLHYESNVLLSDGTTRKIGEIVNNREDLEVVSYNLETGELESKKVINWFNNGLAEDGEFKRIKVADGSKNGGKYLKATLDHEVFNPNGERIKLSDVSVGDYILTKVDNIPIGDSLQIVLGSVLGDGYLSHAEKNTGMSRYRLRIKHGLEQELYCKSKELLLGSLNGSYCDAYYEFDISIKGSEITRKVYSETYDYSSGDLVRRFSKTLADNIDLRGIAIWYMDDGHIVNDGYYHLSISVSKYSDSDVELFRSMLEEKTGLPFETDIKMSNGKWYKLIKLCNKSDIQKFLDLIAPYMMNPDVFSYKLGKFSAKNGFSYNWETEIKSELKECKVVEIVDIKRPPRFVKRYSRYCIEVEDNHNFICDGILVGNSWGNPIYTPGGNALKHVTDVRLFLSSISVPSPGKGPIEKNGVDEYRYCKAKTIKNKVFVPFHENVFRWWVSNNGMSGFGPDPVRDTQRYLEMTGQLKPVPKKSGIFTLDIPAFKKKDYEFDNAMFKDCILGRDKEIKADIRSLCIKQMQSGKGMTMYLDTIVGQK